MNCLERPDPTFILHHSSLLTGEHYDGETVFIGFGSNVGDRVDFCDRAVTLLSLLPHSQVVGVSLLYETEPVNDHARPGGAGS